MVDFYNEIFAAEHLDKKIKIHRSTYWNTIIEGPDSLDKKYYSTYYRKKQQEREANIFSDYDKLGFVINIRNAHWILAVIDNKRQKIQVYDSLLTPTRDDPEKRKVVAEILKMFIRDEALESKVVASTLEAETLSECYESENVYCPLQDGTDCGPHVVKNIECLLLGKDVYYNLSEIKTLRIDIKNLLLELGINEYKSLKDFYTYSKINPSTVEKFCYKFSGLPKKKSSVVGMSLSNSSKGSKGEAPDAFSHIKHEINEIKRPMSGMGVSSGSRASTITQRFRGR